MIFVLHLSIPVGINPMETNEVSYIYYSGRIESNGSEQALKVAGSNSMNRAHNA
jgi:hypothetical protein